MAIQKEMTLGEFLRHEREQRDITLEQVASATKVGVRTLHLLESDQYYELPAKPFIRGFVISYCRFIGLDAQETLAEYEHYIHKKSLERPTKDSGHSGYAFDRKNGELQSRTTLMIAMVSFLVIGGGAVLIFKPSLGHKKRSHIEKLRASQAVQDKIEAGTSVAPVGVPSGSPSSIPSTLPFVSSHLPNLPTVLVKKVSPSPSVSSSPFPLKEKPLVLPPHQIAAILPEMIPSVTELPLAPSSDEILKTPSFKAGENPHDPLDSGLELKQSDIRHRLVFKMQETVWVRFQLDERPMRKFLVRKGNMLILRGNKTVRFQVSNPRSITLNYNHQGEKALQEYPDLIQTYLETATLVFPKGVHLDFFENEKPLFKTPNP